MFGEHNTIPLIRFEVEGIRRTMVMALTEHALEMDQDIKDAVEAYCTKENISNIIHQAARTALDTAIKEEVRRFFWDGEGRKAVAAAVKESILKKETYTTLDEV